MLDLLREGLSNPQISERLGISRDGVKYHVSQILGKLGVASREEAALWQPAEHRPWWTAALAPPAAYWRRAQAPVPGALNGAALALSGALLVAIVGGLGLVAFLLWRGSDAEPVAGVSEPVVVPLAEMFTDPRPRTPDEERELGPPPESSFKPWDGVSTVLYDTLTGEELDLGEGHFGRFSDDRRWMAWTAGPAYDFEGREAWAIDLVTLEQKRLGPGSFIHFVNDQTAGVQSEIDRHELVNLWTGEREVVAALPPRDFSTTTTPDGHELHESQPHTDRHEQHTYTLIDPATGETLLEFDAFQARPAGSGALVVATRPVDDWTNIFIVDISSATATFIASSRG